MPRRYRGSTSFSYSGYQKRSPSGGVSTPPHSPGSGLIRQPTNPCSFTHAGQIRHHRPRADARRLRQGAHAPESVRQQFHFTRDDVVALFREPAHQPGMLAVHQLVRTRGNDLQIRAGFFQLVEVRRAASDQRRLRPRSGCPRPWPQLLMAWSSRYRLAAPVTAAMRKNPGLVHIQALRRRDVRVSINDHSQPPDKGNPEWVPRLYIISKPARSGGCMQRLFRNPCVS